MKQAGVKPRAYIEVLVRVELVMSRTSDGGAADRTRALLLCAIIMVVGHASSLRAQHALPNPYIWQTARSFTAGSGVIVEPALESPSWQVCNSLGCSVRAEADLAAGKRLEEDRQEGCVDLFYRAAMQAWTALECEPCPAASNPGYHVAWRAYQESLARLIRAAGRFGRLDPRACLIVNDGGGRRVIRTAYYGFAWKPSAFCQVAPASEFQGRDLKRHYRTAGLGVSLVAMRRACSEEQFYQPKQPFAVTAVLRPARCSVPCTDDGRVAIQARESEAVLAFYNPCLFDSIPVGSTVVPLERDLSAPFATMAQEAPQQYLQGFLSPSETDVQPRLFLIEPYQRGKIPVVFIHGLLSDPSAWLDAVNELAAYPDLYQRYQFWYYRYPTGGALLESVAKLREQVCLAREQFDPAHQDKALEQMVLVGHSMGGLIARLQVTCSYDILWRHAARQPPEAVRTTPAMRARLRRDFFFEPSPLVTRVVFIGTPHRGANMARRLIGRLASSVVRPFGAEEPQYRQLMEQNRDVFHEYLWRSPPTSVDLLEPDNPLLKAMTQMPYRRGMRLHSIIGTGHAKLLGEPSDGVVPVASARQAGVCSEHFVPARHSDLHHDAETLAELRRILRLHAQEPYSLK